MSGSGDINRRGASDGFVSVQMPARDLGEFLAQMLGQRRRISKEFACTFRVTHDWLSGLVELIDQRVFNQNHGQLIRMSSSIYFADGKVLELYNKSDLLTFNDVSLDISSGARVALTYIIRFPHRDAPERQDIIIDCRTKIKDRRSRTSANELRALLVPTIEDRGSFKIEIQHSDITWGEDIYNLVNNHVNSHFPPRRIWIDKLTLLLLPFAPIIMMFFLAMGVSFSELHSETAIRGLLENKKALFDSPAVNIEDIGRRLSAAYDLAVMSSERNNFSTFWKIFIPPLISTTLLYIILRMRSQSYVVMNVATARYVSQKDKFKKLIFSVLFVGFILSVAAGVSGNAIYSRIPGFG